MTGLRVTFKVINPEDFRKNLDATRALGDLGELNKQLSEDFAKYINTKQVQEQLNSLVFKKHLLSEMNRRDHIASGKTIKHANLISTAEYIPMANSVRIDLAVDYAPYNYYTVDERRFDNFDAIYQWVKDRRLGTIADKKVMAKARRNNWSLTKIQKIIARMIMLRSEEKRPLRKNIFKKEFNGSETVIKDMYATNTHNEVMQKVMKDVAFTLTNISLKSYMGSLKKVVYRHVRRHRR